MNAHYIVVHEYDLSNTRGDHRTDRNVCSSLHPTLRGAENALAYCEGLQAAGNPGSEGRYFIAEVAEVVLM